MRSDGEIRRLATAGFPNNLNDLEQGRWLEIATVDELEASKRSAFQMGHPKSTIAMITAEQYRRVERDRHDKVIERLAVLEKPHWTTTPGFWVAVGGFVLAGLAAWFAWLAIPRPTPQGVLPKPSSLSTPPQVVPPATPATK